MPYIRYKRCFSSNLDAPKLPTRPSTLPRASSGRVLSLGSSQSLDTRGPPQVASSRFVCRTWWPVPPQGRVLRERGNTQAGNVPVSHQPASTNNGRVNHTNDTVYGTESENDDLHGQARPFHGCSQTCQACHDNNGAESEKGLGLMPCTTCLASHIT